MENSYTYDGNAKEPGIESISVNSLCTVGLKSDGTVVRKMRLNPFAFHYDPHTNKLVGDGAWQVARDNSAFLKTISKNGGVGMLKFAVVEEERANQETFKRNDQRNLFDEGGYFDLASVGLSSMTIDVK